MLHGIWKTIATLQGEVNNMSHDDLVNFAILFMLVCALVINYLVGG
jgi:hypothetical protein